MLFGSDGLGLEFHSHEDAQLIGMLSLSVILFSGGMDTKFRDIQPVVAQGLVLSTLGVLLTTAITGMLIFYLSEWTNLAIGLTLPMSMLLAATVSSTDSASVFNLLRSQGIGLKHNLRPTLELESGSNDPMAYVLTIALVDMIVSAGEFSGMELASKIVGQLRRPAGRRWLAGLSEWFGVGVGGESYQLAQRLALSNPGTEQHPDNIHLYRLVAG